MHVSHLRLKNWGPFKGEHDLVLAPTFYAVTARHERDPDRSNWSGKTSLLEAIRFALFGEHRHRHEDSWITDGEHEGSVFVEFDSGPSIERKRVRGKATKLRAFDGEHEAVGDAAREWIERWLGLGAEDFDACHLAQGQASAFVTGDPAARTERVAAWCGLDALERCHDRAKGAAEGIETSLTLAKARRDAAVEGSRAALAGSSIEELEAESVVLERVLGEARSELDALLARQSESAKNAAREHAAAEYGRVVEEGKAARSLLDEVDRGKLVEKVDRVEAQKRFLIEQLGSLRMDREHKRLLARGEFSGACPVAGIECPAAPQIRGMTKEHAEEFRQLEHSVKVFEQDLQLSEKASRAAQNSLRQHDLGLGKLAALRERARELKEAASGATGEKVEDLGPRIAELRTKTDLALLASRKVLSNLAEAKKFSEEAAKSSEEIAGLEEWLGVARAGKIVFGRHGAQKRIAAAMLSDIERRANSLLGKVGVDLRVALEWEREGKGIASECGGCGWGYPSSRQVTSCGACGEGRGPNMIRSLQARLDRVSGAANDLAGLALAFGAFGWLRERREARWAVAMLDECFSQVDKAHRRGVSNRICGMMREAGFAQGFVVSHDASTTAAMPARMEIVSDGKHARIEVIT